MLNENIVTLKKLVITKQLNFLIGSGASFPARESIWNKPQ